MPVVPPIDFAWKQPGFSDCAKQCGGVAVEPCAETDIEYSGMVEIEFYAGTDIEYSGVVEIELFRVV